MMLKMLIPGMGPSVPSMGGDDKKDDEPKMSKEEMEEQEKLRKEAIRQAERERQRKYKKQEEDRETVRASIREKVCSEYMFFT